MDRDTTITRARATELLGTTLLHAQRFEQSLGHCIGLVFSDRKSIGLPELAEIDEDAVRITLGQFFARIKKKGILSDGIQGKLDHVLSERNRMVHRIANDTAFDLDTAEGCRRLAVFLLRLQQAMIEIELLFTEVQLKFLHDVGIMSEDESRALAPDLFKMIDSLEYTWYRADKELSDPT